jgi:hypothetical protein
MKNNWLPNFAQITDGPVTIKHHSTASVIEVIVKTLENLHPTSSLFMDYSDFDSLIECIKSLENDEEYYTAERERMLKIREELSDEEIKYTSGCFQTTEQYYTAEKERINNLGQ